MRASKSVLLIHKTPIVRKGIRTILERDLVNPLLVYEMDNFWDASSIIKSGNCDAVIMDIDAAKLFYAETNSMLPSLLLYSGYDKELFDLMRTAGNNGYIPIVSGCDVILKALEKVMSNETYYVDSIIEPEHNKPKRIELSDSDIDKLLTKREQQILDMVLAELTHDEMAEKLNVSRRTVEGHKLNLTKKLNVKSMIGLTRLAIESGRI